MTPREILAKWDFAVHWHRAKDRALMDLSVPMGEFLRTQSIYDDAAERAVDAMGGWLVVSTPQAVAHGRAR